MLIIFGVWGIVGCGDNQRLPPGEGGRPASGGGGGGGALAQGGAAGGSTAGNGGDAGAAGGGGAAGTAGAGGAALCDPVAPCVEGMVRCVSSAPQSCQRDNLGCRFWGTTPGEPGMCSIAQTCVGTTGRCVCNDDPRCGQPPIEGEFCPVAGGATHATCNQGADGCFTVTSGTPCTAGLVCETTVAALVATGMACGCPPSLADQTGTVTKLLGTGCTVAQAAAGARVGSAVDDAVLVCKPSAMCDTWQLQVACQAQQLTAGSDPVTSLPACVCKPPAVAHQYYVDPNPAMATFMTGQPTGAQFPSACRYRTLTTALRQPGVKEVIAAHESSSNVHFKTLRGSPAFASCNADNSCEAFPMQLPAGVHMYTSDVGSFNPAHYIIDVDATNSDGYALRLADQAFLEGYTIDASATNPNRTNAGVNVAAVVTSPVVGGWDHTPAIAALSALINQVLILSNASAPATNGPAQTALLIQGQAHWTTTFLSIIGGGKTARGIVIDHATDPVAGATAALLASHLNVNVTGGVAQVGIELGTNGLYNGVAGRVGRAADDAGNVVSIVNDVATDGAGAFTPHGLHVGSGDVGMHAFNGAAAVTGLDVTGGPQGFTGYQIDRSNDLGITLAQGSISGAGTTTGGIGILATGGVTMLVGMHITGASGWYGISVRQTPGDVTSAGDVTMRGAPGAPNVIDVVSPLGTTAALAGIQVGLGDEYLAFDVTSPPPTLVLPRLDIANDTVVTHYVDGIVVNNGHVSSQGTNVLVRENLRDGLQVFSSLALAGTDPTDSLARVTFRGTSFTGNGRAGVLLRDVVPVLLDGITVTGNGTPLASSALPAFPDGTGGIDLQRTQSATNSGFLAYIINSTVSGNVGCGITLSGGDDDLVNRTTTSDGVRSCGVGTGFTSDGLTGRPGAVAGPIPGSRPGDVTTETPAPSGVFGGRTNVGGTVSAFIKNTRVQNNTGVGIYVTEARDFDPTLAGDDVTDVGLLDNVVTGNLVVVAPTGTEPAAGGIYFASSNLTTTDATGMRAVEVSDLGCEDPQNVSTAHAVCTRVGAASFLGNVVACNGRAQVAFGLPQRGSASATGLSPDGDWNISSDGAIVGVNPAMRCADVASPNTLAGYSATATSLGLAIPASATTADGISLLHVMAYGVKWNAGTISGGSDFSAGLAAAPQGNGDYVTWGVCPNVTATSCPVP
ncbi:MAG TPA: right-handed parallel beta-helix repeat-containing protein [Polyangia bacterium]